VSTGVFQYQAVEGIYEHAAALVKKGKSRAEVHEDLKSRGLNSERASVVVDNILELRTKARKEAGQLNLLYGALLCVGGATLVTYPLAASLCSGEYHAIAGAVIASGAIQFCCGLAQAAGREKTVCIFWSRIKGSTLAATR
jgi:hypothetical protein